MDATTGTTGADPARERHDRAYRAEEPGSTILANAVLEPGQRDSALRVLAEALAEDGREAVSEQGRLRLRSSEAARPGVIHLLQSTDADQLAVGYAQLEVPSADPGHPGGAPTAELVVAPQYRGRGFGRHLVDALLDEAGGPVDVWAHGGHPAARHLAVRYGAELVRELRQMRRSGAAVDDAPLPEGVTLRTFRPGEDDEAWLRLNALAFAHHPEQGSWTPQDLADRIGEPWFDPNGFFLATRGDRLVGFHWTKVHPATGADPALGEVYVVGVDPDEQGNGLGRALTAAGLRHLTRDRGLDTVLLYVDADNPAAVRVYERLGFTVHEVDLMYRVPAREAKGGQPTG